MRAPDPPADTHGAFVPMPRCIREPTGSGALQGLHFAVKDLIDVAGEITGGGNPDWAATHAPAERSAPVVDRLLAAGARLVGKTMTDELAFSLEGRNAHYGTPMNPRAPSCLPGGSSSGSAVAVAAGLVDFALGTDTGGSVRVPASFCGVFGFRPTHGRVSLDGVIPFAPSYDTVGWFARNGTLLQRVGDELLQAIGGAPEAFDRTSPTLDEAAIAAQLPTRFVLATDALALLPPACAQALRRAADALGVRDAIEVFGGPPTPWLQAYQTLQGAEIQRELGPWIASTQPRFGADIAPRFAGVAQITEAQVRRWQAWREMQRARLLAMLRPGVALIVPSAPGPALERSSSDAEIGAFYESALAVGSIAGHAGLPQLSLPLAAAADGRPLGLGIIGAPGSDESLLRLAAALPTPVVEQRAA